MLNQSLKGLIIMSEQFIIVLVYLLLLSPAIEII